MVDVLMEQNIIPGLKEMRSVCGQYSKRAISSCSEGCRLGTRTICFNCTNHPAPAWSPQVQSVKEKATTEQKSLNLHRNSHLPFWDCDKATLKFECREPSTKPWHVSFSYANVLQKKCLKWTRRPANEKAAREDL
ncbi:hypothetical protein CKAN_01433700 [Cinnamomum micranthum f. kanehirae]|uniref:Uncharacterized protein n=1 Tax=Cinnamomum micranthum f. kanehirae TaxID=337451 RepID=A0A3S3MST6_9MAGN|nr:hypothetical protein CKAN_01433700 [Cinnamomum micranthum f. kanehirae]